MNTLDQVKLLEQKVMSAVEKIKQLQAENDALRNKCAELTNAISSKSEQLEAFESNKNLIESGIQNAIDRLNSIEYSILDKADQNEPTPEPINTTFVNPVETVPSFDNMADIAFSSEVKTEEPVEDEKEETTENYSFNPIYNPVEETETSETEEEANIEQQNIDLEKKIENSFQTVSMGNSSFTNYLGGSFEPETETKEEAVPEEKESPFLNPFDNFDSMSPVENTFAHDAFAPENNPFDSYDSDDESSRNKPDIW